MSTIRATVGLPPTLIDGSQAPLRVDAQGGLAASPQNAAFYNSTVRRKRFAAMVEGITTTVGVATTYTGLLLSNPTTSLVNLILDKMQIGFRVAFGGAATIGLFRGFSATLNNTHTAAAVVQNMMVDGTAAGNTGLVDSSATLCLTPTAFTPYGIGLTGAISVASELPDIEVKIDGSIVIAPGGFVGVYTSAASGASGLVAGVQWTELPVIA